MFRSLLFSLRTLVRSPGYAAAVVLMLGAGSGITTAIYSVVVPILFPTRSYTDTERLVRIEGFSDLAPGTLPIFMLRYVAYREGTPGLESLAGSMTDPMTLVLNDQPIGVRVDKVSANFFSILRVAPMAGRTFMPEEEEEGKDHVVILSHRVWTTLFAADPDTLGRHLQFGDERYRVVGILPSGFEAPPLVTGDYFIPLRTPAQPMDAPSAFMTVAAFGRMRSGWTAKQVEAQLRTITPESQVAYGKSFERYKTAVVPFSQPAKFGQFERYSAMTWAAIAAVGLLYLIAIVNSTNLMMVRAIGRRQEISVRIALGGGLFDVATPFLLEGLILATASAMLGACLAQWVFPVLLSLAPGGDASLRQAFRFDWRVYSFLTMAGFLMTLAIVAAPVCWACRINVVEGLKAWTRGAGENRALRRIRSALVVIQAALATALLVATATMVAAFLRLQTIDPGFKPAGKLVLELQLAQQAVVPFSQRPEKLDQIAHRLAETPMVRQAAIAAFVTPSPWASETTFQLEGTAEQKVGALECAVSPTFFDTAGLTVKAGSGFGEVHKGGMAAAVINESLARRYFAGASPLGRVLVSGKKKWTIVGVVGDTRSAHRPAQPTVYCPYWQSRNLNLMLLVQTQDGAGPEDQARLRRATFEADPRFVLLRVIPMPAMLADEIAPERFVAVVLEVLAVFSVVLAAWGLFAMLSYSVAVRNTEFGIRLAIGASSQDIRRQIVREGLTLVCAGIVAGVALTWTGFGLLQALVSLSHPPVLAVVGGPTLLLLSAIPCCWWAARKTSSIDAAMLLRS